MSGLAESTQQLLSPDELAGMADRKLASQVSEAALHELYAKLERIVDDANSAIELIRELAGPAPSFLPQHLLTMLNMGTGYFRHDRDVLAALFRRKNTVNKEANK